MISGELWFFLIAVGGFFVVGLPMIRSTIALPARMDFRVVPERELTEAQRAFFASRDARLAPLGFVKLADFVVDNLGGGNISRLYRCESFPCIGLATAMSAGGGEISTSYLELVTAFDDGSRVSTRNAQFSSVFKPEPYHSIRDCPGIDDPAELKGLHESRVREHGRAPLAPGALEEILARANESHARFCEFQRAHGLLRRDPAEAVYRATYWTGLNGVRNFLNPFADNFTLGRLALALVVGLGGPGATAVWGGGATPALVAGYLLTGAALGLIFTGKAFIWSFLIGYCASHLFADYGLANALLALLMSVAAETSARLRSQLSRLV